MILIEILKVILIGIVEGITEWLPISSTGHMILVDQFIHLDMTPEFKELFLVVIQLGAILAVCLIYFKRLNPFKTKYGRTKLHYGTFILWCKIIVACIPAAVIGLLFDDWFDEHFYNPITVALMLIIYGILFIIIEKINKHRTPSVKTTADLSWTKALLIGVFQLLSLIPGTSRSGVTILGGILLGCSRTVAADFTFFLAIPVMFGASLLKCVKYFLNYGMFSLGEGALLLIGCVIAFIVSVITIKLLLSYIKKNDFTAFGIYRIVLGIIVIAYFLLNGTLFTIL